MNNDNLLSLYSDKGFRLFTFWEPKEKMPAYIRLCMQTWKKFLPECEVVLLDYSNLEEWLGIDVYDEILFKDFSLPKQADAIRCALLKKYGGLWLDADTILTSPQVKDYLMIDSELVMISKHLAFIKANNNSKIIADWYNQIQYNLKFYKDVKYQNNAVQKILHPRRYRRVENWDYLGNYILHKMLKTKNKKKFFSIDRMEINALPELNNKNNDNLVENYQNFYFENDYSQDVIKNTKGIILLHNSWTPQQFLEMNEEEFLSRNNTLSNVLKTVL
ncbi:TPA: hypothetical protein CPT86_00920 [Candidatus Gastranaerophilales bacterium HUM_23]|nr:MAG TPA: hypothetical protein CPT97_05180 [Candidatus Gastranaerophilales bacterium HUM_17]DAB26901.1 MAG TPA: hypothetical protein CPT86_00920 [Candidatus Gastranaerophilales bacterium HUM_23]